MTEEQQADFTAYTTKQNQVELDKVWADIMIFGQGWIRVTRDGLPIGRLYASLRSLTNKTLPVGRFCRRSESPLRTPAITEAPHETK